LSKGRIALGGVLLVALALWALRAPIAVRVMERVLARNMAADPLAELPDGLHVLLCGAGGPLPDPVRSGPCVAVVAGRTMVLVDAGSGGARNLGRMQLPPGLAEALFLTHFHSDHIDGLGEIALSEVLSKQGSTLHMQRYQREAVYVDWAAEMPE
jgi:ribonuclease Z